MTIGDYIKQLFEAPRRDGSPQSPEELAKIRQRLRILGAVIFAFVAVVLCWIGFTASGLTYRLTTIAVVAVAIALMLLIPNRRFQNWVFLFCLAILCAGAIYRASIGEDTWVDFMWLAFIFVSGFLLPLLQKARDHR